MESFISQVRCKKASLKQTWDIVRKISGHNEASKSNHLKGNGESVTEKETLVNALGETYQSNFASENYSDEFKNLKAQDE